MPPPAEPARAKVEVAYHEVAQQLHYLQLVHALTHQPQFNAFGQPQPFHPSMLPPAPVFTYGRSSGAPDEGPAAYLTDEEARRRLANGRRRGLKRKAEGDEGPAAPPSGAGAAGEEPSTASAADGTEPAPAPAAVEAKLEGVAI